MARIVAITGVDGAGKSSIIREIARRAGPGVRCIHKTYKENVRLATQFHRRPLGGRNDWLSGSFAHDIGIAACLDFLVHYNQQISPHLGSGSLLICDRYVHCYLAYLAGAGFPLAGEDLMHGVAPADLIIHVTVDPARLTERYLRRGEDEEDEFPELMERFEAGYQQVLKRASTPVASVANDRSLAQGVDAVLDILASHGMPLEG